MAKMTRVETSKVDYKALGKAECMDSIKDFLTEKGHQVFDNRGDIRVSGFTKDTLVVQNLQVDTEDGAKFIDVQIKFVTPSRTTGDTYGIED